MFRAPRVRPMALAGTRKRSTPIRRSMVLCLFLAAGSVAAQSWNPLDSGTFDTLNVVYSGSFADCWVVGDGGFVAVASDCTNFSPVDVAAGGADLTSLTRGSSADIWVGGEQGVVRRRVAGVWELRDIPGAVLLYHRSAACRVVAPVPNRRMRIGHARITDARCGNNPGADRDRFQGEENRVNRGRDIPDGDGRDVNR